MVSGQNGNKPKWQHTKTATNQQRRHYNKKNQNGDKLKRRDRHSSTVVTVVYS